MTKGKKVGRGGSQPEDKGKGQETKPLLEAKGPGVASKAKDAAPEAKKVDPKSKEADPKAIDPFVS